MKMRLISSFYLERNDYNKFVVNVLSYERDLGHLLGQGTPKPWDVILYRNGSNPVCAMVSLFYYFMSDVLDKNKLLLQQRRRMFDLLGTNPNCNVPKNALNIKFITKIFVVLD